MKQTSFNTLIVCLTLLGFGLRIFRLNFQPLWGDEGWSFYFAAMPLSEMLVRTAADIHPPFYYFLLHIWLQLAGFGAESARWLSVMSGTLLIPTSYVFAQTLAQHADLGTEKVKASGLATASLISLAPMAIYYSQEVRMYGLVTLLALLSTLFFLHLLKYQRQAPWPYIIVSCLMLYTMYFGGFILVFHGIFWLIHYRRLTPSTRKRIFQAFLGVGALYLPWILFASRSLIAYVTQKTDVEGYIPLSLFAFLRSYIIAFSAGHPSSQAQVLLWLALTFLCLATLGVFASFRGQPTNGLLFLLGYLIVPLLIGWGVNLVSPFTPRFFERTLLLAAPAWWTLVGFGLMWLWWRQRLLGIAAAGLVIAINIIGLVDFFTVPRYPDEDYRPLLAKVSAIATPDDILLASYQWQLGFYHAYLPQPQPKLISVPGWGQVWGKNIDQMTADLDSLLVQTVWFPAHQTLGRSWETKAEAVLAERGYPSLLEWYSENTKLSLVGAKTALTRGQTFNFQGQLQAQVNLSSEPTYQSGRGIIPLEIYWKKLVSFDSDYRVTLKLVDESGELWALRDSLPQAAQTSFQSLDVGQTIQDRHGLLVSAGTPPGLYELRLSVTTQHDETPLDLWDEVNQPQGVEASLMSVQVIPPIPPIQPQALARRTESDWVFDNQLKLVGYSVNQWAAKSGDDLPVNLFWQSMQHNLDNLTIFVQLQNEAGQALALTERPPVYPTTNWTGETLLRDLHKLRLPATIPTGTYRLAVGVLKPDKRRLIAQTGDQVILGDVVVETRAHTFDAPNPQFTLNANFSDSALLIGYDLEFSNNLQAGDLIDLTLYWHSQAGFNRQWTIFAHIIDGEGRIWGQQDQVPGDGEFPTTSWIPDEYITDTRQIRLNSDAPSGTFFIKVGLYDATSPTFERVIVDGSDAVLFERPIQASAGR
ncbi:MAG: glycosyltransferase family 39 protein [Chloroflexota bacterium]